MNGVIYSLGQSTFALSCTEHFVPGRGFILSSVASCLLSVVSVELDAPLFEGVSKEFEDGPAEDGVLLSPPPVEGAPVPPDVPPVAAPPDPAPPGAFCAKDRDDAVASKAERASIFKTVVIEVLLLTYSTREPAGGSEMRQSEFADPAYYRGVKRLGI